jgi:hypothetical protein
MFRILCPGNRDLLLEAGNSRDKAKWVKAIQEQINVFKLFAQLQINANNLRDELALAETLVLIHAGFGSSEFYDFATK